jgi:4-carboxymuconolactone decarboxylase
LSNNDDNKTPADKDDITGFAESYAQLFGSLPAMPAARFKLLGDLDPESLLDGERLRAKAFYSDVFDVKTTQLVLFGMLLIEGHPAAAHHALAARRAGASWEELLKIVELACVTGYLRPANQGAALIQAIRDKDEKGE